MSNTDDVTEDVKTAEELWEEAGNRRNDEDPSPIDEPNPDAAETHDEEETGGETQPVDIWVDASPEQRKELEELQRQNNQLKSRVSGQDRKINELSNRQQRSAPPKESPPWEKKGGSMDDLVAEFGDGVAPLVQTIEALESKLQAVETSHLGQVYERNAEELKALHPGFTKVIEGNTEEFKQWISVQPEAVQGMYKRNADYITDVAEADVFLRLFKTHLGEPSSSSPSAPPTETNPPPSQKRKRQKDSATAANGGSKQLPPLASSAPETGDAEALWNARSAEIEKSREKGII